MESFHAKICSEPNLFVAKVFNEASQRKDVFALFQMKTASKVSPRKNFSKSSRRLASIKRDVANMVKSKKDLPTKQEVDADQEIDNVTWADRLGRFFPIFGAFFI